MAAFRMAVLIGLYNRVSLMRDIFMSQWSDGVFLKTKLSVNFVRHLSELPEVVHLFNHLQKDASKGTCRDNMFWQ